jgi:hypothetical protein
MLEELRTAKPYAASIEFTGGSIASHRGYQEALVLTVFAGRNFPPGLLLASKGEGQDFMGLLARVVRLSKYEEL